MMLIFIPYGFPLIIVIVPNCSRMLVEVTMQSEKFEGDENS
jgi:hypothetical protein